MDEREAVKEKKYEVVLGGKLRGIKYGFRAWAEIEETFGGVREVFEQVKSKPFTHLPKLIFMGLTGRGDTKESDVLDWMDDMDMSDLKPLLEVVKNAMTGSMPEEKKGKSPPKAETK